MICNKRSSTIIALIILGLVFRIVVAGEIGDLIRDGSARVFRFDEEYELTEDQV